ncbi:MAG: four helix bundle suffix domain-containing protein [Planctomycetaceae bacterium]|nr:four helix bundle suffix domain-containing protein [Planctomycetaceae bacterium]
MGEQEKLIPKHGAYRKLKTFQLARLIYDLTVRFCELYIEPFSRMRDQMIQAARSGVQNIAEGSQASGTSKKSELKLTNVGRASLEELKLDYEDFLRQNNLRLFKASDPVLIRFKTMKCCTLDQFREWLAQEQRLDRKVIHGQTPTCTDARRTRTKKDPSKNETFVSELAANAALSLININCHLLNRQIAEQAEAFEKDGGFTERLYRIRSQKRMAEK